MPEEGLDASNSALKKEETRESFRILLEISNLLETGLSPETLAICIELCEQGVNPEMLATMLTEMQQRAAAAVSSHQTKSEAH